MEYSEREGMLVRRAWGTTLERRDVRDAAGWHNWQYTNLTTTPPTQWALSVPDSRGRTRLGAVGASWPTNGPKIPASADCRGCHKQIDVVADSRSTPRQAVGVGLNVGKLSAEASIDLHGKSYTKPAQGPPGPRGPAGPAGTDGRDGKDGQITEAHIRLIIETVMKNVRNGKDGRDGVDGKPGLPGEVGVAGPAGPRGEKGASGTGTGSEIDYDILVAEVIRKLPPVKVHFMDRDNTISRTVEVRLGGELEIPPSRLNLYDDVNGDKTISESETFKLVEPLGEPLKIEVTGGINAGGKKGAN